MVAALAAYDDDDKMYMCEECHSWQSTYLKGASRANNSCIGWDIWRSQHWKVHCLQLFLGGKLPDYCSLFWPTYFSLHQHQFIFFLRLGDRSYDKRKNAALEITALIKVLLVRRFYYYDPFGSVFHNSPLVLSDQYTCLVLPCMIGATRIRSHRPCRYLTRSGLC